MLEYKKLQLIVIGLFSFTTLSCEKWIEIPPPISTITNPEAASDSITASATISGLYSIFSDRGDGVIGSALLTATTGLYCDELEIVPDALITNQPFALATIPASNSTITNGYWAQFYNYIYHSNAIIENLTSNKNISEITRNQFLGEAKFIRAYCYFMLTNIFGDVPLITITDYRKNTNVQRDPTSKITNYIIEDLIFAKQSMRKDFQISDNQRVRANSYSAAALLAKVYLFQKKYAESINEVNYIISATDFFSLESEPINAFNKNSNEAILQFACNTSLYPYTATGDGLRFVEYKYSPPSFFLPSSFLTLIKEGDKRSKWIDSTDYDGIRYYYPYKYKIGAPQAIPDGEALQFSTLFRLADMILIRAECSINTGMLEAGIEDINTIRRRAGLKEITSDNRIEAMEFLETERKIELFCEYGNRWFDLKRWEKADSVNNLIKPNWKPYKKLFPIPLTEIQSNTALIQNQGYQH